MGMEWKKAISNFATINPCIRGKILVSKLNKKSSVWANTPQLNLLYQTGLRNATPISSFGATFFGASENEKFSPGK